MARYKVILAYDGTHFQGFQRQGNLRTVQLEVEKALHSLGWDGKSILGAGRTDAGVHAAGQVLAFDFDWRHTPEELVRAMNARLTEDVAVQAVFTVPDEFHPRYDALWRCYHYHLFCDNTRKPLRERYAWRVYPALDLNLMQQAAGLLVGTYDFAAFGQPHKSGGSTVRAVYEARWDKLGSEMCFVVRGNAFLYHMVRRLVFLQTLVGQGRLSVEQFAQGVQRAQPQPPGLAPSQGLVLTEVCYSSFGKQAREDLETCSE